MWREGWVGWVVAGLVACGGRGWRRGANHAPPPHALLSPPLPPPAQDGAVFKWVKRGNPTATQWRVYQREGNKWAAIAKMQRERAAAAAGPGAAAGGRVLMLLLRPPPQ